jgi:transcriptional regulator with XRE-family HTH domain
MLPQLQDVEVDNEERDRRTGAELQAEADEYMQFVAEQLKLERSRRGIKQTEVSERAGRSKAWAGTVERNENGDHAAAKLYALAIGVDFALIVARAEASQANTRKTLVLLS